MTAKQKRNKPMIDDWKIYTGEEFDKLIRDCFECGTSLPVSEHIQTGYHYICKKCNEKDKPNEKT